MLSMPIKHLKLSVAVVALLVVGCGSGDPVDNQDENDNQSPEGEQGFFSVEIDVETSLLDVAEDSAVSIDVDVENTGDASAVRDVALIVDGAVEDVVSDVELDVGESMAATLQWQTAVGHSGDYTAEVSSGDDSDSASGTIYVQSSIGGTVTDDGGVVMAGAEVVLFDEDTGSEVAADTIGAGGTYEIAGIAAGSYELGVRAPGLNPDYVIEESADGANMLAITIEEAEAASQDLTVDWMSRFDLMVDGGILDFQYADPDGELAVELPGCSEQPDGSWEPIVDDDPDSDVQLNYTPEGECFRIDDIDVTLVGGALDIDVDDILFPNVELVMEDSDEFPEIPQDGIEIQHVAVDFQWLVDDAGGTVDYTDGSIDVDIDFRILIGGTILLDVSDNDIPIDFGARAEEYDCQLTGNWGGDITDPLPDELNRQLGDYLHDPLQFRPTTGASGPDQLPGQPYNPDERRFVAVDNGIEIDRLSEGPFAADDPGGPSCGDLALADVEEDFAEVLNDLVMLPAESGSVFGEWTFVVP